MDQRLIAAAQEGDINALYVLIRDDSRLLERIDDDPFIDTPLHIAAANGRTHFAIEVLGLKPSFGRKLNQDGFSPIHLALQNGHAETVRRLVEIDSELVRVQGKERMTLLHCAAEKGDTNLLAGFLCICPASIKDKTIRGETALHIAVRNGRVACFEVLLGWLSRIYDMGLLNWEDENGNTVLHIAASTNQPKVVRLLIKEKIVYRNVKNLDGLTALDLILEHQGDPEITREVRNVLLRASGRQGTSILEKTSIADLLSSKESLVERYCRTIDYTQRSFSNETKNALLVVAVLIATTTYQAVLTPPDALQIKEGTQQRFKRTIALIAVMTNTITFVASIAVILVLMEVSSHFLQASLMFQMLSYGLLVMVILPFNHSYELLAFFLPYCIILQSIQSAFQTFTRKRQNLEGAQFFLQYPEK